MSDKLTFSVSKLVQELKRSVEAKYKESIALKNPPDEESFRVSAYAILKNIIDNKTGNLTEDEKQSLRQEASVIIPEIVNEYASFLKTNNVVAKNTKAVNDIFNDPEVRQISANNYGAFYNGKLDPNVSAYAATNSTYSMADMVCTIEIMTNLGKRIVTTLGTLQTLSYSIYQNKAAVRCIGNMNAKDYVFGQRTIAGSLVFAVFNKHWLMAVYDELKEKGGMKNWHFLPDEIPPFNITISFANEYGFTSKMAIYGVRLMNEGQTMSTNDIYIENTYQYVATDIEMLDTSNSWASNSKYQRRYQTSLISGSSSNKTTTTFSNNMIGTKPKTETNATQTGTNSAVEAQKVIANLSSDIKTFTIKDLTTKTKDEILAEWKQAYKTKKESLTDLDAVKKLNKAYTEGAQNIIDYYNKKVVEKVEKA